MGIILHRGPLGNLEGDRITGTLKDESKRASGNTTPLNEGALRGETERRAPLLWTAKDMPSKSLEIGFSFYRIPFWRT